VTDTAPRRRRWGRRDEDHSVGVLELFFDLVYVYAMSQVTTLVLQEVSWTGFARGVLALAAIWWRWENYAWLTNTVEHADPPARILIFLAMVAMLIAATALPAAFAADHARHAYSYLHLPLITGSVFFAIGVDEAVAHPGEPLAPLPGLALASGLALFYLGELAHRWRDHHRLLADRLVAGAAAVVPIADRVPAVATLGALLLISAPRVAREIRAGILRPGRPVRGRPSWTRSR
jgi:low temperature requirement protein LtrA